MVAGLECFDPNLLPHLAIFALGVAMFTPLGESLALPAFRSKWPSLETKLGRTFGGLLLICFSGFTVSAHTLWMHNKSQEMGAAHSALQEQFVIVLALLETMTGTPCLISACLGDC